MTEVIYGFFSYAHADAATDKALFEAFARELPLRVGNQFPTRTPVRFWRDDELRTGDLWDPKIEANLRASKFLVVMLSPQWLASDYCRREFGIFCEEETKLGARELIVPILVRDVESKQSELTEAQRAVYAKLAARQYKSARVTQFYRLTDNERIVELEKLAEEIYPRLKPFIEKPEPPPAPVALSSVRPPPAALPPHNLPLKSLGALFMGRDAFMVDLEARLKGDGAAAVTEGVLQGMGGVGKTRLAIEYAWRHAKHYAALLFVSAETPETLATGLAALAATLDLPEKELPQDPVKREAVLRWLAGHDRWLLILDNVDDAKAAAAVADLLPRLTNGVTLITARYDNFPATIETMPLGVLGPEPARDFLLARTKTRRRAAPDDDARAAELAKELGYLALGLEQAGAFIAAQRISFERYLAYWRDERARVVDWFDKTAMSTNHNEGLAAVFATSVACLSPNARQLLDRIAFLAPEPIPEFILKPVARLSNKGEEIVNSKNSDEYNIIEGESALAELYYYSLATPTQTDGIFKLFSFYVHRLIQYFIMANIGDNYSNVLEKTLAWIASYLDSNAEDDRNWPVFSALVGHAQCVAHYSIKAGLIDLSAFILNQAAEFLRTQAKFGEAENLYEMALNALPIDTPFAARILNNLAIAHQNQHRHSKAMMYFRKAIKIDKKNSGENNPEVATIFNNIGYLLKIRSRFKSAETMYHRALTIDEKFLHEGHPNIARDHCNIGRLLHEQGKLNQAGEYLQKALLIDRSYYGNRSIITAGDMNNLASWLDDIGRNHEATKMQIEALQIMVDRLGVGHPNTLQAANNYMALLINGGIQPEDAKSRAVAILFNKT